MREIFREAKRRRAHDKLDVKTSFISSRRGIKISVEHISPRNALQQSYLFLFPKMYYYTENLRLARKQYLKREMMLSLCIYATRTHRRAGKFLSFCLTAITQATNQRTIQVIYHIPAGKLAWFWHSKENVRLCTSRVRNYYWSWSLKLNCANNAPFVSCCYWKFWRTHIPESYENILLRVFYKHICILRK